MDQPKVIHSGRKLVFTRFTDGWKGVNWRNQRSAARELAGEVVKSRGLRIQSGNRAFPLTLTLEPYRLPQLIGNLWRERPYADVAYDRHSLRYTRIKLADDIDVGVVLIDWPVALEIVDFLDLISMLL